MFHSRSLEFEDELSFSPTFSVFSSPMCIYVEFWPDTIVQFSRYNHCYLVFPCTYSRSHALILILVFAPLSFLLSLSRSRFHSILHLSIYLFISFQLPRKWWWLRKYILRHMHAYPITLNVRQPIQFLNPVLNMPLILNSFPPVCSLFHKYSMCSTYRYSSFLALWCESITLSRDSQRRIQSNPIHSIPFHFAFSFWCI